MMSEPNIVILDDEPDELLLDATKDNETLMEPPDWLPDGWIMEVREDDEGSIHRYYTSPISDVTFTMKSEVLEYLFSETDQHILDSRVANQDTLLKTHEWLPKGWFIEVRAGGKNMDKMYKFYSYPPNNVRVFTKDEVLLYVDEMKISKCDTEGQCDTTSEENILATVEFNPSSLPPGWVKEVVFRKTKGGSTRKDPYYTDPISHYAFRTLKSALCYLETGKFTKRVFIQKTSVHDMYDFEKCADLHENLRKRLMVNWTVDGKPKRSVKPTSRSRVEKNVQTSYNSENGGTSTDPESLDDPQAVTLNITSSKGKGENSSKVIKGSRGRPPTRAEDSDTSCDSESPYEPEEIKSRHIKAASKDARSTKTMKHPREVASNKKNGESNGKNPQSEQEEHMIKTKQSRSKGEIKQEAE